MTFFTTTQNLTLSFQQFSRRMKISRNVLKYRIKLGGHRSGSNNFGGKLLISRQFSQNVTVAAQTSRVFSRRHAATVTLQCKTELYFYSAPLGKTKKKRY